MVRHLSLFFTRWCLYATSSVVWMTREEKKVCYKKYLGPNWKPDNGPCANLVPNHQAFQDIFIHTYFQQANFVMKEDAIKIPLVKYMAM